MEEADTIFLDIYNTGVSIRSAAEQILQWLRFDFSHFLAGTVSPWLRIEVNDGGIPAGVVPPLVESMHSPEYVCYDDGHKRYVDYYGRALVVFDYQTEHAIMYFSDPAFMYEKLYLLILSRVGEKLDREGLHRVHALAISYRGAGCLFLMPSHGGKSTLALSLLGEQAVKLLSEDTPLIDHKGNILPFPLKLGLGAEQVPPDVPAEFVRTFVRDKWGAKTLLHLDYFPQKIETSPVPVSFLFAGKWIHTEQGRLEKLSRTGAVLVLLRDCVFGLGLPQIVEYFLTSNKMDLLRKTRIVFGRFMAVLTLALKAEPYRLLLGRDIPSNKQLVIEFLEKQRKM
jgi:hypothetical protein